MLQLKYVYTGVLFSIASIVLALFTPSLRWTTRFWFNSSKYTTQLLASTPLAKMGRTPVYFLSHGGPNIMYDTEHPAYAKLQEIGKEITQKVKPKAVVVFSAHWQAEPSTIEVNTAEINPLIYEYVVRMFAHRQT